MFSVTSKDDLALGSVYAKLLKGLLVCLVISVLSNISMSYKLWAEHETCTRALEE